MKAKCKSKKISTQGILLRGFGICTLSLFSVLILGSMLILMTKDPLGNSDRFSPLIFALCGGIAGLLGKKCTQGKTFLLCPPLLMLTMLLIGLFLSGGRIAPSALLSEGIYLGAAYLLYYISGTHRKKPRRHH